MEFSVDELRHAAFEHLHLIYVRENENGTYNRLNPRWKAGLYS
jgi:hypothetical protein